jgi:malonyl-CoA/methylmalonyl-CoA synthetase
MEYFLADARPAMVVTSTLKETAIAPLAHRFGARHLSLDGIQSGSLAALATTAESHHRTCPRVQNDLAGLLYTSGTTGRSKGAMLTHGNLLSNAQALHRIWGFVPEDILLHALPVFHVHGLYVALNTAFLNGSRIIWLERFDVSDVLGELPRSTIFMGVPTFYSRLLADPRFDRAACRSVRLLISGSAPLLPETHAAVFERTGHRILERYGMTEAGMIASNPLDGERIAGTVGFPLPGVEVRIAGPDGRAMEPGELGVIEIRGPNVFAGYWRREQTRAEDFRADGFFMTGDIGIMDRDGRLSILGRAKDLIITGGLNVYPREIEQLLDALPGIGEAAVIGVPHPDFGEGVIAVVTAASGLPDEMQIIGELAKRLAGFKLPKRVYVIDEMPRNAMGKIQKNELRRRFAAAFSAQP